LEQYAVLLALLSVGKDDAEVLTVIRCCVLEKLTGACQWDAFGKAEITKACGPPNNWITRQTVATGAMEQWLTPAFVIDPGQNLRDACRCYGEL